MIRKDDVQWWLLEARKNPQSAPTIIEALAQRLLELDAENERLRGKLIQRQQRAPAAADSAEVGALRRRVAQLQELLEGQAANEPLLIALSGTLQSARLPLVQAQQMAYEARKVRVPFSPDSCYNPSRPVEDGRHSLSQPERRRTMWTDPLFAAGGCFILGLLSVVALILLRSVRLLYQYERGVIFTLGRYSSTRNPGLTLVLPILQTMRKVDMRIKTADIPRQEVMTRDNIPMLVNAVVYFKVINPADAIIKIEDFVFAVRQYTQAALRDVIGNSEMDFVLTEREQIADSIKKIVDAETSGWGVDVEAIKIQEVELPAEMKRAMAKQAEAERERRAVIIASQGELSASENLRQAAENLAKSRGALHLRTLQTIRDIAADPSEKIVLFVPSDLGSMLGPLLEKRSE